MEKTPEGRLLGAEGFQAFIRVMVAWPHPYVKGHDGLTPRSVDFAVSYT